MKNNVNNLTNGEGVRLTDNLPVEEKETIEEVSMTTVAGAGEGNTNALALNVTMVREEPKRFESLDLLRLISMWFIVCIHYVGFGGAASSSDMPVWNYILSGGIGVACNCAVNCFFLISGFFISKNETLKRSGKKILKVWIPTFIYSVFIPMLLLIMGVATFSGKQIVGFFFPIMTNQYWFSTVFIAMTALLPFIAKTLHNIDDKMLWALVGILFFLDSIMSLWVNAFNNIGYGILHALTMYVIGFTIRRTDFKLKKIWCALIFIACVGLIGAITVLYTHFTGDRNRTIADYNSPIVIIQAIALFMFFLQLKIKIKFSKIAPYVFGVYLLHENQWARTFLWQTVLKTSKYHASNFMILHWLLVTIGIVVIAIGIEFIRIHLAKWINIAIKKLFNKKDNGEKHEQYNGSGSDEERGKEY